MRVLVCGSRDWTDREIIARRLYDFHDEDLEVIHGAARGADRIAGDEAEAQMLSVRAFPADWERHGKVAGFIRNVQMLDEEPDLVLAFQINGSRGTQHTIDEARKRGIPVEVIHATREQAA
jgi:hypothetical protein